MHRNQQYSSKVKMGCTISVFLVRATHCEERANTENETSTSQRNIRSDTANVTSTYYTKSLILCLKHRGNLMNNTFQDVLT